ncbi:potassium channel family protein [Psychroflexus aestuariivivens]|uniref:potassium channel family protein n=1 Tax=Psychroflexus aestuariivivens TaxID=1795040 RepID=UPI000FD88B70|nr:TrkA family potassium uptake protein [Psychroflexus aestuariivivens]
MKYIIVGLGNFGASLAQKLTALDNEVIGVDKNMDKVDYFKEKITHTIRMDATDEIEVSDLPLDETDVVVIAIGEDQGENIMTTALFKNLGVKELITRAMNPLHKKVLQAIGVDKIVHPEAEIAERWSNKLHFKNILDSFELNEDFSIVQIELPEKFAGKTLKELDLRKKHNLLILTTIKKNEDNNDSENEDKVSENEREDKIRGILDPTEKLKEKEILVIFGKNSDINTFIDKKTSKD